MLIIFILFSQIITPYNVLLNMNSRYKKMPIKKLQNSTGNEVNMIISYTLLYTFLLYFSRRGYEKKKRFSGTAWYQWIVSLRGYRCYNNSFCTYLFYDTAAILNCIVFRKTLWDAQGEMPRKFKCEVAKCIVVFFQFFQSVVLCILYFVYTLLNIH
jgi:hypothetical protein